MNEFDYTDRLHGAAVDTKKFNALKLVGFPIYILIVTLTVLGRWMLGAEDVPDAIGLSEDVHDLR